MGALIAVAAGAPVLADRTPVARTLRSGSPTLTHGVVVGDVRARSAVVWARASREGLLRVSLSGGPHRAIEPVAVRAEDDYTAKVRVRGLRPATTYKFRLWFTQPDGSFPSRARRGTFRTAPPPQAVAAVRVAFGGDVGGQNVCRGAAEGYPIMETIRAWDPDIFIALGDMIYGDDVCAATGRYGNAQVPGDFLQATDLEGFWAHWRYNRDDRSLRRLMRAASYVGVWDDHEVLNDFGPLHDTGGTPPYTPGVHLLPIGLEAFLDYTPIVPSGGTPNRLYRSIRWGRHLQLFVLDNRQYRDANIPPDSADRPKTMLGREQLAWLEEKVAASTATWKVIVSSVPMSIPTGFPAANGRDGWANFEQDTGFEQELLRILSTLRDHDVENVVWITTDVHFAEVFRYRPFGDRFVVHEIVTGPLAAGIFPSRSFDTTLNPESLFFYGLESFLDVTTWEQAKTWFNFGTLRISRDGTLTAGIVNTAGETVFSVDLTPET